MPMNAAEIEQLIKQALPDADIMIEDLRGDGDHYAAYVKSAEFKGKTRVQQHQLVYKALAGRMGAGAPVDALSALQDYAGAASFQPNKHTVCHRRACAVPLPFSAPRPR